MFVRKSASLADGEINAIAKNVDRLSKLSFIDNKSVQASATSNRNYYNHFYNSRKSAAADFRDSRASRTGMMTTLK